MTEFILENQIWIIFFGVLILMAMIGYMVEKKKGTKKEEKETKKPEKEIKSEEPSDIVVENPIEPTSVPSILDIAAEMPKQDTLNDIPTEPVGLDSLVSSEMNENSESTEDITSTVTESGEDLSVPLDVSVETQENVNSTTMEDIANEIIMETESMMPTEEVVLEEPVAPVMDEESAPVENTQPESELATNDLGMDDISYLFTENKKEEETSPEDVWKF